MKAARLLALALLAAPAARADPDRLLDRLADGRRPGFVFDYAGAVRAEDAARISDELRRLEQQTTAQVKVVVLPSLEGGQIEDFANRLFERWGLGVKGKDNGVLLLAALEERRVRIEVGYGLEPVLNDAAAGRLLDTYVLPAFRSGDVSGGLAAGAGAVAAAVARGAGVAWDTAAPPPVRAPPAPERRLPGCFTLVMAVGFVVLAIRHPFLALMLLSGGRGGGFGGGGFGGGGFGGGGFGGGLSGGGGASRGW